MRAWQMQRPGNPWDPEAMTLVDAPAPTLRPGSVRLAVQACDLNFADILQCQGTYQVRLKPPFVPGMGAAGVVLEAADDVALEPGQKVVGPTLGGCGGFADEALMLADQVTVIDPAVDAVQAAAAHVTYGTAWFSLHHRGRLEPGESVLVLAAAGGVGSAAVDLAKVHGCYVIAAAGGAAKLEVCRGLGADAVVDYDNGDLYAEVMKLTDGRGVDVVYDPVGGSYFDVARRLVAWEGRLLVVGFASGDIPAAPLNHALVKNYSIVGVHMGGYRQRDPEPFAECYTAVYAMLAQGTIKPLIDRQIGFSGLPEALTDLSQRRSHGRIIFAPGD